jgi:catechol 2,3-dioxygenase-like lactoylglutathione lyase family enzyme
LTGYQVNLIIRQPARELVPIARRRSGMGVLTGVNHIATVSEDLDALIDFYDRIFGATVLADEEIPHMVLRSTAGEGRRVMIELGGPGFLHAWQIDGVAPSRLDGDIFERGRVDHFSLAVDSYADFEHVRQKLVGEALQWRGERLRGDVDKRSHGHELQSRKRGGVS